MEISCSDNAEPVSVEEVPTPIYKKMNFNFKSDVRNRFCELQIFYRVGSCEPVQSPMIMCGFFNASTFVHEIYQSLTENVVIC